MIEIRKATQKDIEPLFEMIMGIAKYHEQSQFVLSNPEELFKAGFSEEPLFEALIAEYEGKIAGYLSYTWNYSIWKGEKYMNLDDLFVKEAYRSKKIGEHLMQAAKQACLEKGINTIRWEVQRDNVKAISFYQKLGAKMREKGIFKWGF